MWGGVEGGVEGGAGGGVERGGGGGSGGVNKKKERNELEKNRPDFQRVHLYCRSKPWRGKGRSQRRIGGGGTILISHFQHLIIYFNSFNSIIFLMDSGGDPAGSRRIARGIHRHHPFRIPCLAPLGRLQDSCEMLEDPSEGSLSASLQGSLTGILH